MELDEDVCNQEPYSHYDMVSLVDYFIALEIPGAQCLPLWGGHVLMRLFVRAAAIMCPGDPAYR